MGNSFILLFYFPIPPMANNPIDVIDKLNLLDDIKKIKNKKKGKKEKNFKLSNSGFGMSCIVNSNLLNRFIVTLNT